MLKGERERILSQLIQKLLKLPEYRQGMPYYKLWETLRSIYKFRGWWADAWHRIASVIFKLEEKNIIQLVPGDECTIQIIARLPGERIKKEIFDCNECLLKPSCDLYIIRLKK
jgi:hypothetical protein